MRENERGRGFFFHLIMRTSNVLDSPSNWNQITPLYGITVMIASGDDDDDDDDNDGDDDDDDDDDAKDVVYDDGDSGDS